MSVYSVNASDDDLSYDDNSVVAVEGNNNVVSVGQNSTVSLHGMTGTVNASWDTVNLNGINLSLNGTHDQVNAHDDCVINVNGGGNSIQFSEGYITLDDSGAAFDTLSGFQLEVTALTGSRLNLDGNAFDVFLGDNCLLQADSDNTNIYGSDDRIHTGGAALGGDLLKGNDDRVFVGANSQLQLYGDENVVYADDLSSLAVTGSKYCLIGAGFSTIGLAGSDLWIGGNGPRGAVDLLTGSNITVAFGCNSNVTLNGDDDTVAEGGGGYMYFVGGGVTARIGSRDTVTINSNGHTGALDTLTGGLFSLTVSTPATVVLDTFEVSALLFDDVTLSIERSGNKVIADNRDAISVLSGVSNQITLGADDVISDHGYATTIIAGTNLGATTIYNFDHAGVIDFYNLVGNFTTADAAVAALTSDGAGGVLLKLGQNGSIDFVGASNLSEANFKID